MEKSIEEMAKDGTLRATERCQPSSKGVHVRLAKRRVTVTDGPFAETKEMFGGFATIRAKSNEELREIS